MGRSGDDEFSDILDLPMSDDDDRAYIKGLEDRLMHAANKLDEKDAEIKRLGIEADEIVGSLVKAHQARLLAEQMAAEKAAEIEKLSDDLHLCKYLFEDLKAERDSLKAAIDGHNARCQQSCDSLMCVREPYHKDICADCPRQWMIEDKQE